LRKSVWHIAKRDKSIEIIAVCVKQLFELASDGILLQPKNSINDIGTVKRPVLRMAETIRFALDKLLLIALLS